MFVKNLLLPSNEFWFTFFPGSSLAKEVRYESTLYSTFTSYFQIRLGKDAMKNNFVIVLFLFCHVTWSTNCSSAFAFNQGICVANRYLFLFPVTYIRSFFIQRMLFLDQNFRSEDEKMSLISYFLLWLGLIWWLDVII